MLSCVYLRSVYLEELLENVPSALFFEFGSFVFKPFQRCCQSYIGETALTSRCSFGCSLTPTVVPNIPYVWPCRKGLKQVKTEVRQQFCLISVKMNYTVKQLFKVKVAKTFCRPLLGTICVSYLGIRRKKTHHLNMCGIWIQKAFDYNFLLLLDISQHFQISKKKE